MRKQDQWQGDAEKWGMCKRDEMPCEPGCVSFGKCNSWIYHKENNFLTEGEE